MSDINTTVNNYLSYCKTQKRLDDKTLKAYRIDLKQFCNMVSTSDVTQITTDVLENIIAQLNNNFKPKTVKRKIASIKAFFHYLEYKDIITTNPFNKMLIKLREPKVLPKTIPLHTLQTFLTTLYDEKTKMITPYQKKTIIKNIAIIELLFATGMRISELCTLTKKDVDLYDGNVLIHGKGKKERCISLVDENVINILKDYEDKYADVLKYTDYYFVNRDNNRLSEQSVRCMINKYADIAGIEQHITPHMFRHTFATSLLENDVDIRYIQELLGHSSINTTTIYTHVTQSKQRKILKTKHPRKDLNVT